MKKNINILLGMLILLSVLVTSCGEKTVEAPGNSISKNGYGYTMHKSLGGEVAVEGDEVFFHLEVYAQDSMLYDSRRDRQSGGRAQQFKLLPIADMKDKTNPLLDALPMMAIGDSMTIYFPTDSLPKLPPGLEDEKYVAYNISVKEILSSKYMNGADRIDEVKSIIEKDIKAFNAGRLSNLVELAEGYKALIHQEGNGPVAKKGDYIKVHYYGALKDDSSRFDDSFNRNSPFVFRVEENEVIEGWDIAASTLKKGTKATLFIPSKYAYGDRANGAIKANADLVFYIELL